MPSVFKLTFRKFGNTLGVVLPKEVTQHLRTGEGERLFLVETGDRGYLLIPHDRAFLKKMTKADEIAARFRNTLDALSK